MAEDYLSSFGRDVAGSMLKKLFKIINVMKYDI